MELREKEYVLKVYHHHPTPFVLNLLKITVATLPFFLLLFVFQSVLSPKTYILLHILIFVIFSLVIVYYSLIFWLDKLIITNQRIIYIDWKVLTKRNEAEAELDDIQDILTEEAGFLSYFSVFDYGVFRLDTASSYVTIEFIEAPDPEGIRQFVYHIRQQ